MRSAIASAPPSSRRSRRQSRVRSVAAPATLFDKIWSSHAILVRPDGATLLHIDRHFVHDGSGNAFRMLNEKGLAVRRPDRTFATPDHYGSTLSPDLASINASHRPCGVTAKAVILAITAQIGTAGGVGHVIEYAGATIRAMGIEGRLTICNMSIEAGARAGMVAPDETAFAYLHGRPYAPEGADWDAALAHWAALPSDADAQFDREVHPDAAEIAPMVTWGTIPQAAAPITARLPAAPRLSAATRPHSH